MKIFGITDRGSIRPDNQDAFRFEDTAGRMTAVVCDGMGGAAAGAVASALALESFFKNYSLALGKGKLPGTELLLQDAVSFANYMLREYVGDHPECTGMGTTLVGFSIVEDRCSVVHVGDSRCYLFRRGKSLQITTDHSYVQELVDMGQITEAEARVHPNRNIITRAVGTSNRVKSDCRTFRIHTGDTLLLCSDGLSGVLEDTELREIIFGGDDPEKLCGELLAAALEKGAPDNVTAVVLRF